MIKVVEIDKANYVLAVKQLNITVETVEFEIPNRPRYVTAREHKDSEGYISILFAMDGHRPDRPGSNPIRYLIAGETHKQPQYYRRLKLIKMRDGLRWYLYYDNREEPGLCLAKHPYFDGEHCRRKVNHSGNHQAREEAISPKPDGTDFSDWGHALSIDWPR
ncbi:hypothetical protein HWC06_gp81 [Gordonia phage Duffington]|uniref:Uncharacterized protein n=1 Tax=Gordonia phage Duffington TaxID=2507858 RepID=A0A410TCN5_9CAUD|nr:hypothetical protein HWC06_gp81 [Gordonia phage Duffington]QAU06786.1 hypothetical protein SEA_DUFFINGTON_81 [Gordonia phage Duffington]